MMSADIGYQADKKHAGSGTAYIMSRDTAYGVSSIETDWKEEFILPADQNPEVYASQRT